MDPWLPVLVADPWLRSQVVVVAESWLPMLVSVPWFLILWSVVADPWFGILGFLVADPVLVSDPFFSRFWRVGTNVRFRGTGGFLRGRDKSMYSRDKGGFGG